MIQVVLPFHLCTLAGVVSPVDVHVEGDATITVVLDSLEAKYPMLRGTIRDHVTKKRRPFLRYFACNRDLSHEAPETRLPDAVINGTEPFRIVGAIAGG